MTAKFNFWLPLLFVSAASAQMDPPRFEIGPFGGMSRYWVNQDTPNKADLVDGGLVGFRFTVNLAPRGSIEFSGSTYGVNNVRVPLSNALPEPQVTFGSRSYEAWIGPVLYLSSLERRWVPFVKVGPAAMWWVPTEEAKHTYNFAPYYLEPHMSMQPAVLAGIGLKGYFSRRMGVRFDIDGIYSGQPHYHLPGGPGAPGMAYIETKGGSLGARLTAEIFFGGGHLEETATAPPAPAPAPPEPRLDVSSPEPRTVNAGCPGDATQPVDLTVTASTSLPGHKPAYQWNVDGSPAGEDSPAFRFLTPAKSGQHTVSVTVSDNPADSSDKRTASPVTRQVAIANVQGYQGPAITGTVSPQEINQGQSAALSLTPRAGACGGQVTYTCQASDGSVTGTPPAQFDSTNVAFDMSDRSKPQSKTVNISCTVADARGGKGSVNLAVVVDLPAVLVSQRFDDVVFPANNSRVNNCGKHILLEEVAKQLAEHPDWDLVVVGHRTENERAAIRGSSIDRERVLNVVATLTAGTDTCSNIDISRVKVGIAGSTQKSEMRPAFCGTSTRPAAVERQGQSVATNDPEANGRRVEIYLVPKGAPLPDAADGYEVVPQTTIAPRGCPK